MMRHKMNLKPFVRMLGNASLAHIMTNQCYGRLMLVGCWWDDKKHKYGATYECKLCGKIAASGHNKPGDE